jgi:hypothetical protein
VPREDHIEDKLMGAAAASDLDRVSRRDAPRTKDVRIEQLRPQIPTFHGEDTVGEGLRTGRDP